MLIVGLCGMFQPPQISTNNIYILFMIIKHIDNCAIFCKGYMYGSSYYDLCVGYRGLVCH